MKWNTIAKAKKTLQREEGYVVKDWGGRLPIVLAYANSYQVGMSSLGFQILYRLLNDQPKVVCERVFWSAKANETLVTIESQHDVLDAAVLAVSLSFELDYLKLMGLLAQAAIPPWAAERDETYPLVLLGGPAVTANPEPLALIADAIFIGEAEEAISPLTALLWDMVDRSRSEVLEALVRLPGMYVPARSPLPVPRQWVRELDAYPATTAIYTPDTEFGDMVLMEISRGCGRGCRFCMAGYTYRPPRERGLDMLLAQAEEVLRHRRKIGLVGAAISDYSQIEALVAALRARGAEISVSSLRVKPLPERLIAALAESGTRTLTMAPEAGCDALRRAINKGIEEDDILHAVELAQRYRFPALKLYFMVGLPGEEDEDVQAIVALVRRIAARFGGALSVNASPFVPKAHTPFQWAAMADAETLERRLAYLQAELRRENVELRAESVAWSQVQGVLARGDRRLNYALANVKGSSSLRDWEEALHVAGCTADEFLRARTSEESLPWQTVDMHVRTSFLAQESAKAASGRATALCIGDRGCEICGVCHPQDGRNAQGTAQC